MRTLKIKNKYTICIMLALLALMVSCREEQVVEITLETEVDEPIDTMTYSDWTEETHGNTGIYNYDVVFNQDEVTRFDIEISSSDWSAMQSNLDAIYGRSGNSSDDPDWVKCQVIYEGKQWYNVGVRYKGNSSLESAYSSGNNKLSFKLDFDEFEDDYTGLNNQRFYGFRQLNLNNNYNDLSLMREKMGADLFREFGLASAQTSFCVVYVTVDSETQYYGVYTIVEEVDDTAIKTQFAKSSGNLYKPDGDAASFYNGTYDTDEMELKTNTDSADYSDVKALYDAINSSERTSDIEAWKTQLESVFNVDGFLKWLAANTTIQNWDTYGRMTHNFYLYSNPEDSLLTWIPWDNNEAFEEGKQQGALNLSLSDAGSSWPLIYYIIAQPEYEAIYESYLQSFIDDVFIPTELSARYETYYEMLKEYAYAEESGYTYITRDSYFDAAVETLKSHASTRNSAVESYLN